MTVDHLWFLFNTPGRPFDECSRMRVAAKGEADLCDGRDLYIDTSSSELRLFDSADPPVLRLLDPLYLAKAPALRLADWKARIKRLLSVRTLPRFLDVSGTSMSVEFEWLVANTPCMTWLQLLRDNWDSTHANEPRWSVPQNHDLAKVLSSKLVRADNGTSMALGDLYIGTSSILDEPLSAKMLPLLSVEDPGDKRWHSLEKLGLRVLPDLHMYMDVLLQLKDQATVAFDKSDIQRIYSAITDHLTDEHGVVRDVFDKEQLVYLHSPNPAKWVGLRKCRWSVPSCLTRLVALRHTYPDLRTFFCTELGIGDADTGDVVTHLLELKGRLDRIELAKEQLVLLSRFIALKHTGLGRTSELLNAEILSVREEAGALRAPADSGWFTADRARVGQCFQGRLWLLDFDMDQLALLQPLIARMGLQKHSLSAHVVERTEISGASSFNPAITNELRSKAPFISRLVPENHRESSLDKLAVIEVYLASSSIAWNSIPHKQLAEQLASVHRIDPSKEIFLLMILATNSIEAIEDALERANIGIHQPGSVTFPEDEDVAGDVSGLGSNAVTILGQQSGQAPRFTALPFGQKHAGFLGPPSSTASSIAGSVVRRSKAVPSLSHSIIDVARIEAAATAALLEDKTLVSISNQREAQMPKPPAALEADNAATSFGDDSIQPSTGTPSRAAGSTFDLSGMGAAIQSAAHMQSNSQSTGVSLALTQSSQFSAFLSATEAPEAYRDEVGHGGELFIYKFLKAKFNITDDCWTSHLRELAGLEPFLGDEGACADFTIDDQDMVFRIALWLTPEAVGGGFKGKTIHLEVKATVVVPRSLSA
ncbi:uncharacterized protein LTR77_010245 [Saxophila tyrrhenica]|uniref:Uncharacterized protein n=1 Tax=Saxophila tyrrhenica TaxID=1690608 RepID=A0AAV9NW91_9PEZI|nr:hypothetical protein LTR77_010245 [Saxophila tyrrhenica]